MEKYEKPAMEIVELTGNVITTSPGGGSTGGDTEEPISEPKK